MQRPVRSRTSNTYRNSPMVSKRLRARMKKRKGEKRKARCTKVRLSTSLFFGYKAWTSQAFLLGTQSPCAALLAILQGAMSNTYRNSPMVSKRLRARMKKRKGKSARRVVQRFACRPAYFSVIKRGQATHFFVIGFQCCPTQKSAACAALYLSNYIYLLTSWLICLRIASGFLTPLKCILLRLVPCMFILP